MSGDFVTTVRVRPARGKVLSAVGIDHGARSLVEVTVWGRTVAIADVVGPSLVWLDPALNQPASRDQIEALVRGARALMQTAKERGICEPDDASVPITSDAHAGPELLQELGELGE